MNESGLKKALGRAVLYVGLALASLTVAGLLIALSIHTGLDFTGVWLGLAIFTASMFWVVIRLSREYWRRPVFWILTVLLFCIHLLIFTAILRAYPEWRMIWFWPIMVVEGSLFFMVINAAMQHRPRRMVR